jgi:hypothetical protein
VNQVAELCLCVCPLLLFSFRLPLIQYPKTQTLLLFCYTNNVADKWTLVTTVMHDDLTAWHHQLDRHLSTPKLSHFFFIKIAATYRDMMACAACELGTKENIFQSGTQVVG